MSKQNAQASGPIARLRLRRLLGLFLLSYVCMLFCFLMLELFVFSDFVSDEEHWFQAFQEPFFTGHIIMALLAGYSLSRAGLPFPIVFQGALQRQDLKYLALIPLLMLVDLGLSLPNLLLMQSLELGPTDMFELWHLPGSVPYAALKNLSNAIFLVVLGPVVEELVFRVIFLHRFCYLRKPLDGIILSSLIFGLLHGLDLGAVFFGIVMALLYLKSQNIKIPILLHMFYNLCVLLISIGLVYAPDFILWRASSLWLYVIVGFISLVPVSLFLRQRRELFALWPPFLKPVKAASAPYLSSDEDLERDLGHGFQQTSK